MTPIYFTSPSNDQFIEHNFFSPSDHQTEHQFLSPKSQASTSSDSPTCHLFFNPITTHDQDETFNRETHPTQNEVTEISLFFLEIEKGFSWIFAQFLDQDRIFFSLTFLDQSILELKSDFNLLAFCAI